MDRGRVKVRLIIITIRLGINICIIMTKKKSASHSLAPWISRLKNAYNLNLWTFSDIFVSDYLVSKMHTTSEEREIGAKFLEMTFSVGSFLKLLRLEMVSSGRSMLMNQPWDLYLPQEEAENPKEILITFPSILWSLWNLWRWWAVVAEIIWSKLHCYLYYLLLNILWRTLGLCNYTLNKRA